MVGFLNINKPCGVSSAKVVAKVKYLTKTKAGHLGTLDLEACGVLPIAIGKATRLFDYFLNKDKVYIAKMKFGVKTDTLDTSGVIVDTNSKRATKEQMLAILPKFIGKQLQMPPQFSAKKINGKCAYDLARNGQEVKLKPKEIEIFGLELLSFNSDDAEIKIHCSSGTYVRSLISDIGKSLNILTTTNYINRVKSGCFEINNSIDFNGLSENDLSKIITIEEILKNLPKVYLNKEQEKTLLNGLPVEIKNSKENELTAFITEENKVYGIGQIINNIIKINEFLLEN